MAFNIDQRFHAKAFSEAYAQFRGTTLRDYEQQVLMASKAKLEGSLEFHLKYKNPGMLPTLEDIKSLADSVFEASLSEQEFMEDKRALEAYFRANPGHLDKAWILKEMLEALEGAGFHWEGNSLKFEAS